MKTKKKVVKKLVKKPAKKLISEKPKKKVAVKLPVKPEFKYQVALVLATQVYKSEGDTLLEAFDKLELGKIAGKAILKVEKGKLKSEMVMYPQFVRRFLVNKVYKILLAKRLELALR